PRRPDLPLQAPGPDANLAQRESVLHALAEERNMLANTSRPSSTARIIASARVGDRGHASWCPAGRSAGTGLARVISEP
ncbi:MAG TPA: hypothetical protein PKC78_17090, partial [Accumulibacter sp.]|uniref:hypothetical protein n=1 Tax=Accumulibacter sp. TaxID=2053492 RepID=UPI002B6D6A95